MTRKVDQPILFALLSIFRKVKSGENKIAWHQEFKNQGVSNPNYATFFIRKLSERKVIKINKKETYWSKVRTGPNPILVKDILDNFSEETRKKRTEKKNKEDQEEVRVIAPKKEAPQIQIQIWINGIPLDPATTSITWGNK